MNKLLLDLPAQIETERLLLRSYHAGDGVWYYPMSLRNQEHLKRFEAENPVMTIHCEQDAEIVVRDFAAAWMGRRYFFMAAFEKETLAFAAQIYLGVVDWDLPEFEIGYFADEAHEGQGYVTEAVKATVGFTFEYLKAHRIRLECDDTNVRSARVAERCGFVQEGHFRQNKKHADGTTSGTLFFSMLRSEYEAGR